VIGLNLIRKVNFHFTKVQLADGEKIQTLQNFQWDEVSLTPLLGHLTACWYNWQFRARAALPGSAPAAW